MAEHLREQTIPEEMVAMADYYLRGVKRAEVAGTAAIPRQDMPIAVAQTLGLDATRTATHEEVVNLLQGRRADGEEIAGRQTYKVAPGKDRITYVEFHLLGTEERQPRHGTGAHGGRAAHGRRRAPGRLDVRHGAPRDHHRPRSEGKGRLEGQRARQARLGQLRPLHGKANGRDPAH